MLTQQHIDEIKHDAEKITRRRFEDAAEEGAFVPTPTPGETGVADEQVDPDHVLGTSEQREDVEKSGKEQNENSESVEGLEEKPKRGRPAKPDKEEA